MSALNPLLFPSFELDSCPALILSHVPTLLISTAGTLGGVLNDVGHARAVLADLALLRTIDLLGSAIPLNCRNLSSLAQLCKHLHNSDLPCAGRCIFPVA